MERKILPIYFLLLLSVFLIQQVSSQELSCKGRCFESFTRGRACDCDSECKKYGKCCSDYDSFCEKVKDNKKKRTPKKKPTPEPPVIDEAGNGPDNGDFKLTPTPDIPTTQRNKVTTTPKITIVKPILSKPSIPPNSDTTKETPLTANKEETTDETKETSTTNKQTSTTAKEKTTSAKEKQNAEKTSTKDFAPTSEVPATSTLKAETISKSPALTSPKEPDPTTKESTPVTTKEPAPTTKEQAPTTKESTPIPTKEPAPTTTKEQAPTTKESTAITPKKPAPTIKESIPITTKEPAPTTTKAPAPTTTKEQAPTTKESTPIPTKEPAPTTTKEQAPTTKESTAITPKKPAPTIKESIPITTKEPAPTTTKAPAPTTTKEQAPTTKESTAIPTKEPAPTTPKEPAPTTKESTPITTKEQAPTTKESTPINTKEPAPTTTKAPAPTTPKEPASATPKEPTPSSPNTPAPTTSEASTSTTTMEPPTTPKGPAESTPEFPVEPTPKTLENSPKEPAVPTTKAPKVTKSEMTTTAKDKATEKDTTDTMASSKITLKATTLAPKVMTATKKTTEETISKPESTTAIPKGTATNSQMTTPKPPKPTKAPKKLTCTKKPKTPKVRKPKTTPTPPKMTSAMPKSNPTSLAEAKLQTTTTSPNQTPNSEIIEVNPKNEDADATEGEKPHMIPRPPVLTPIVIPGADFIGRGPSQGIGINPMFSDETNLCNGRPVDGLTTLRNGTLVAFRGHYFWMLNAFSPPSPPRRITEVWGIPSPIDTVFTRCNCEGKTFFFKDSQYWRFTNDIKDAGYPKLIPKGFGGLNGKIVAALSIAKYKNRPESVYFFKRGGSIQQYTYKQEPTQKCTRRNLAINYSVYGETTQVRRHRFERAIEPSQTHTIRIHLSPIRVTYQDKGFLHNEVKVSTLWRGLPNVVTSAVSLPNIRKPDGYDYYAFSKDQYYNIDVPTRTARAITTRSGQTLPNVWYNCP
ncbi:proteoglycan 4 isoform X8 [Physeter macrocephalus]|uniref:Proteoglycan 4 isoform X8 n=1 Tax=Physeter macrocephalus TaxID=9755 RepID=A0A9W2WM44_PHYMC|nr:proteoglycan 4 isoform X8 [Physeter catodon]